MKHLFYFIIFLLPLYSFAQIKPTPKAEDKIVISKKLTAYPGELYVDSVKVNMDKTFLDPTNIKEYKVFKPEGSKDKKDAKGATLITRRSKIKLMSLAEYVKSLQTTATELKDAKRILVQIDNKLITDFSGYKIEKSTVTDVYYKTDGTKKDKEVTIVVSTKAAKKKK